MEGVVCARGEGGGIVTAVTAVVAGFDRSVGALFCSQNRWCPILRVKI